MSSKMVSSGLVFTWTLAVLSVATVLAQDPSWESSEFVAKQGSDFSVTCSIHDVNPFKVVRIAKEDTATGDSHTLADRGDVQSPFKETGRFSVGYNLAGTTATMMLTITEPKGEDAGRYSCFMVTSDDSSPRGYIDIKVHVPVDEHYITMLGADGSPSEVPDSQPLTLTQDFRGGMGCHATVEGSQTPPTMRVYVDDVQQHGTGADWITTEDFEETNPGPLPTWFAEKTMKFETSMPDHLFNGKEFRCEVETDGFDPVSVTKQLVVQYAPLITCTKLEYYAMQGGGETEMVCDVKANPLHESDVSWSMSETDPDPTAGVPVPPAPTEKAAVEGENAEGTDVEATENHVPLEPAQPEALSFHNERVTDEHIRTTLYIKSATELSFGKYYVHAENEFANKVVPVKLTETKNPQANTPNMGADDPHVDSVVGNSAQRSLPLLHVLPVIVITTICHFLSR